MTKAKIPAQSGVIESTTCTVCMILLSVIYAHAHAHVRVHRENCADCASVQPDGVRNEH